MKCKKNCGNGEVKKVYMLFDLDFFLILYSYRKDVNFQLLTDGNIRGFLLNCEI